MIRLIFVAIVTNHFLSIVLYTAESANEVQIAQPFGWSLSVSISAM